MLDIGDVELYVEERGTGTPILGIHGTPSSALLWAEAAEVLGGVGRCITYDRRGFYRSPAPEDFEATDLADQIADAVALLTALGAAPAVVIGRSTGGQIALGLAHRHPEVVIAMALLEPAVFTLDPQSDAWARRLRTRVLAGAGQRPGGVSEAVISDALGGELWDSLPEKLRTMFAGCNAAVLAEIRGDGLDLSEHPLTLASEELSAITVPTLLVSAADSPIELRLVNNRLAASLPVVEHVIVPGGHLIDPAETVVVEFVRRFC
jgi:pimeloyl-ACP methyl ester carboxylesterase